MERGEAGDVERNDEKTRKKVDKKGGKK